VIRAVHPQLIGAISAAAGSWWLQTMFLANYSSVMRIFLSGGFSMGI
jgi:hypothetical protein